MSLFEFFQMGGIFMWPLLLFSMATVAISLERAIFIFRHNLRMDDITAETIAFVRRGDPDGAGQVTLNIPAAAKDIWVVKTAYSGDVSGNPNYDAAAYNSWVSFAVKN